VKQPGHEVNDSPPSSAKVKNEWRYTFIALRLHGIKRKKRYLFTYNSKKNINNFFPNGPTAHSGPGPSRSHSDTPHSVGLLWSSDQPVAETST
jgi:hypothetical protein